VCKGWHALNRHKKIKILTKFLKLKAIALLMNFNKGAEMNEYRRLWYYFEVYENMLYMLYSN
jgi:hypothetical protein